MRESTKEKSLSWAKAAASIEAVEGESEESGREKALEGSVGAIVA